MFLANYTIPPENWHHNPNLCNSLGETVAMILANKGITPPKEWEHYSC